MNTRYAEQTHELSSLLVDQAPDAIIFADTDGWIRVWNAAAARMFGFTEEQAIGESLDIIIPERLRDAHWRGFYRALEDHVTQYVDCPMPTRAVRGDGSKMYVELSFAIVLDRSGAVVGSSAHARDITERFEKEKAAKKAAKQGS